MATEDQLQELRDTANGLRGQIRMIEELRKEEAASLDARVYQIREMMEKRNPNWELFEKFIYEVSDAKDYLLSAFCDMAKVVARIGKANKLARRFTKTLEIRPKKRRVKKKKGRA